MFPLEDYYKLDSDNKMETYKFGIIYINEEDKFQMQEIDTAFNYIPDESNKSVIYSKDITPISVGVKPVAFDEENTYRKCCNTKDNYSAVAIFSKIEDRFILLKINFSRYFCI